MSILTTTPIAIVDTLLFCATKFDRNQKRLAQGDMLNAIGNALGMTDDSLPTEKLFKQIEALEVENDMLILMLALIAKTHPTITDADIDAEVRRRWALKEASFSAAYTSVDDLSRMLCELWAISKMECAEIDSEKSQAYAASLKVSAVPNAPSSPTLN